MVEQELLKESVINVIKSCYDPEIPVNIWDLGLIYSVDVNENNNVRIVMTLTAPNCPVAESLPAEVREKAKGVKGVGDVKLELVFDPPWNKDMMTEEAKLELGFL